jgi:S-DNA-T family DNA segregation ATPase FtsK/SpoIIIE
MSNVLGNLSRVGASGWSVLRHRGVWLGRWCWRHRRWVAVWVVLASATRLMGAIGTARLLLAMGLLPGVVSSVWVAGHPASFELLVARPNRRFRWWWFARVRWQRLARVCGLSDRQVLRTTRNGRGNPEETHRWVAPLLWRVKTHSHSVELLIRTRAGQTLSELETGAERIANTFGAVAHRVRPVSGSTLAVHLVMADALTVSATAQPPRPDVIVDSVRLGRTQTGQDWRLRLRGRHTLVAGCSGAGKGSVLWGICCGLAPAVRTDIVRLWGIDLKRGVELAMGERLFSTRAYTPTDALDVLKALMRVIDARGQTMAGTTRLHQPTAGDPLHVLVIDELAALTAYADLDVRREAGRMLAEILTQGRALGVVVVACLQDPRKDVVAMRGLFTQAVALRLRSADETVMVLGDGMSHLAPAHRIRPTHPGTAWVVDDTGAADRVRADYWPDPLIREVSTRYATGAHIDTTPEDQGVVDDDPPAATASTERKPRAPRKPRASREPRSSVVREEGAA